MKQGGRAGGLDLMDLFDDCFQIYQASIFDETGAVWV